MCGLCEVELGPKLSVAKRLAKIDPVYTRVAKGLIIYQGLKKIKLKRNSTIEQARKIAVLSNKNSVICKAVAIGADDRILWERIESINFGPNCKGAEIEPTGEIMAKAVSPTNQIKRLSNQLSEQLFHQDRIWVKPYMTKFLQNLDDVNWNKTADIDRAFSKAIRVLRNANVKTLYKPWTQKVEISATKSAEVGRQFVKNSWLPRITGSLTGADQRAVDQIAKQNGWFLRGQNGIRSDGLTKRGLEIVQAGIRDGLGTNEIGSHLKLAMPELWNKYGNNYANLSANVAVQRARSYSQASSYLEAGIELLEIIAVLDERTTNVCRFLDGQTIRVSDAFDIINAGANVSEPEDIYTTNPFVKESKNDDGSIRLATNNGVHLADVTRSGVGRNDDRGEYSAKIMSTDLPGDALIGLPPYHHLCRTDTAPVFKSFQVPDTRVFQSVSGPPPIPRTLATGPKAIANPGAVSRATTRPLQPLRKPVPGYGTKIGDSILGPGDPYQVPGLLEDLGLAAQVERRTSDSVKIIRDNLNAARNKRFDHRFDNQENNSKGNWKGRRCC
jgi:hypothetical protein